MRAVGVQRGPSPKGGSVRLFGSSGAVQRGLGNLRSSQHEFCTPGGPSGQSRAVRMLDWAAGNNPMEMTICRATGSARLGAKSKASAFGPRARFGESKLSCEILSGRDAGALVCRDESKTDAAMRRGRQRKIRMVFLPASGASRARCANQVMVLQGSQHG